MLIKTTCSWLLMIVYGYIVIYIYVYIYIPGLYHLLLNGYTFGIPMRPYDSTGDFSNKDCGLLGF